MKVVVNKRGVRVNKKAEYRVHIKTDEEKIHLLTTQSLRTANTLAKNFNALIRRAEERVAAARAETTV